MMAVSLIPSGSAEEGEGVELYSAPVTMYGDALEVYSSSQLDFISQMLKKVPLNMHYVLYPVVWDGGSFGVSHEGAPFVEYLLAYGSDVEVTYSDRPVYNSVESITISGEGITFLRVKFRNYDILWGSPDWELPFMGDVVIMSGVSSFTVYNNFDGFIYHQQPWSVKYVRNGEEGFYLPTISGSGVSGTGGFHGMYAIWSDVGYFPDLRDREEVYSHAQAVILASFVLFAVFCSLRRSLRGRDT